MESLLGPICLFSLFILPFLLTDVQRRNCAVQLIRMHPQQLSLLSSKLIKQMPPYPTFYKEQHVIDRSLARKRLYFNFDWLGFSAPPNTPLFSLPLPPKKRGRVGWCPSRRFGYDHVGCSNNIVRGAEDSFGILSQGLRDGRAWVCVFSVLLCVLDCPAV